MISSKPADSWQELVGNFDPLVLCAPKTWGDSLRSPHMSMPMGLVSVVTYIQNNLVGRPWGNHLVLLAAVLYSQNIQYRTVATRLSVLHRGFDDLFLALGLERMDQWEVDKHVASYLRGEILAQTTAWKRITFWRAYHTASLYLKRWVMSLPHTQQEQYRLFLLPRSQDSAGLTRLSRERENYYEQREKRKAETDAIAPFYAQLRNQAHLRYNLLTRLRKAYHQAIAVVEQGKGTLPFEFEMREGGNFPERLLFRLWDRRALIQAHPNAFDRRTKREARNQVKAYSNEKNSYLLEFVRAESVDDARQRGDLWFLELLERNVLGSAASWGSKEEVERNKHGCEC